jgi:hypothetical protein
MISKERVESVLAAFWAPPPAIPAGAHLLLMPDSSKRRRTIGLHAVPLRH